MLSILHTLAAVHSPQLGNTRDLLIYLPPGYETSAARYPVLYMQDGQNLFDPATAFGGQDWQVRAAMDALSAEGRPAIVVGLPHMGPDRIREYNPIARRGGRGDLYLAFLVETVKPLIDAAYRTRPERAATGILGSSMGGLISLYAYFRHPAVFGLAGALSPAFWYGGAPLYDFVREAPHPPGRLYLDHGSGERTNARRMVKLLRQLGYQEGHDLMYVEEEGGEHNEAAWARRLPAALRFLLA